MLYLQPPPAAGGQSREVPSAQAHVFIHADKHGHSQPSAQGGTGAATSGRTLSAEWSGEFRVEWSEEFPVGCLPNAD